MKLEHLLITTPLILLLGLNSMSNAQKPLKNIIVDSNTFKLINTYSKGGKFHFLLATAKTESNLNPNTRNGSNNEIGMFQIMPNTGKEIEKICGYKLNLKDPNHNTYATSVYTEFILEQINKECSQTLTDYDYIRLTAACYNAGTGHLRKNCSIDKFPKTTQNHVKKFMKNWNSIYVSSSYKK